MLMRKIEIHFTWHAPAVPHADYPGGCLASCFLACTASISLLSLRGSDRTTLHSSLAFIAGAFVQPLTWLVSEQTTNACDIFRVCGHMGARTQVCVCVGSNKPSS